MDRKTINQWFNEFRNYSFEDRLELEDKAKSQKDSEMGKKWVVFCLWNRYQNSRKQLKWLKKLFRKINLDIQYTSNEVT